MSQLTQTTSAQLRQIIFYHLDNGFLTNALFLSERLYGLDDKNDDMIHLLALCHERLGQYRIAYDYSRDKGLLGQHLGCSFIFAKVCLQLSKFSDGIQALEKARPLWRDKIFLNKHSDLTRCHIPDAAAVCCLLGKLHRSNDDIKKAIFYYVEALKVNPFMWDAFTELCDLGAHVRVSQIFRASPEAKKAVLSLGLSTLLVETIFPTTSEVMNTSFSYQSSPMSDPFNPAFVKSLNETGSFRPESTSRTLANGSPRPFNSTAGGLGSMANSGRCLTRDTIDDDDVIMGESDTNSVEPESHQVIRNKSVASVASTTGEQFSDGPKAKLFMAKQKLRGIEACDSVDAGRINLSAALKRTVSGHPTQAPLGTGAGESGEHPQRRSARLFNQIKASTSKPLAGGIGISGGTTTTASVSLSKEGIECKKKRDLRMGKVLSKSRPPSSVGRVVSGNRKPAIETSQIALQKNCTKLNNSGNGSGGLATKKAAHNTVDVPSRDQKATQYILDLLFRIGTAYYCLSMYQCKDALKLFESSLNDEQRETPWILAQIGKAYYEQTSYSKSEDVFRRLRKVEPSRMQDMEVFSTVLWHHKNGIELAYLSHRLIEIDRLSPQAWCSLGNSFSLQREHDQAIKCFRRATQLDSKFSYAFTLQGHEHIENEEFEKALQSYRMAISVDERHYHGWYGLGRVYERLGKFEMAEKHYRAANRINPTNAVLIVRIGIVLQKMRKMQSALDMYTRACDLEPRPMLCQFARLHKARALLSLNRPYEALTELEVLKDLAPDVANVHFFLARAYKMIHDRTLAVKHYTIALNLDPKAANLIKEQMEMVDDADDGFEEVDS